MENTLSKWVIDPQHSVIQFKAKHLAIANVTGTFKIFKGHAETSKDDFDWAKISFEMDTNSLDTNNTERDKSLRSPIFFDVEKFPVITFNGTLQKKAGGYELEGPLTIRDITKTVQLQVEYNGTGMGRFNDTRAGFEITGKIYRKDFGLTFNMLTEAGSLVVGEEIKLHFDIELIKQAS